MFPFSEFQGACYEETFASLWWKWRLKTNTLEVVENLHWCSRELGLTRTVLETYHSRKYISFVWLAIGSDGKVDVLGISCSHVVKIRGWVWSPEWGQHKIKDKSHPNVVVLGLVSSPLMILSCLCDRNALWQPKCVYLVSDVPCLIHEQEHWPQNDPDIYSLLLASLSC